MTVRKPVSVRQLDAVVDELERSVSPQRAKQLRMVAGMWARAVDCFEDGTFSEERVSDLFLPDPLLRFWGLSVTGQLRRNNVLFGRPLSLASQRIVRDCVKMLAERVAPGAHRALPMLDQAPVKPTVRRRNLSALYAGLVYMAGKGPLERDDTALLFEDRARLLALMAVVLDCGARAGELASMRVTDLSEGEATIRVVRGPQRHAVATHEDVVAMTGLSLVTVKRARSEDAAVVARVAPSTRRAVEAAVAELTAEGPLVETYALREGTRVAVRRWLKVREQLVEPLEGGKSALWVTVAAGRWGPAGVPLTVNGLHGAVRRGVEALNWVMAGEHGWEPMPSRLEQLRRSVDPVPLD